jgi:hypothetical protein
MTLRLPGNEKYIQLACFQHCGHTARWRCIADLILPGDLFSNLGISSLLKSFALDRFTSKITVFREQNYNL